jgi:hypothetical protein
MSFFGELDVESVPAQVKRNKPVGAVVGFSLGQLERINEPSTLLIRSYRLCYQSLFLPDHALLAARLIEQYKQTPHL